MLYEFYKNVYNKYNNDHDYNNNYEREMTSHCQHLNPLKVI